MINLPASVTLSSMKKNGSLENLSREELIAMVKDLSQRRKFGLVWEDKPEEVAELCEEKLPVLKEVVERHIERMANKQGGMPPCQRTRHSLLPDDGSNLPTHLIIEGDNYHSLFVLNYTHAGKVDVIYIDPPYNTGNKDFIYNDRYVDKEDSYRHSKWLSFMEKRLVLAKNLLTESGVIFISIDDNEQSHLRLLCDSIFGEENFVFDIIRKTKSMTGDEGAGVNIQHEVVICFAKNKSKVFLQGEQKEFDSYKNPDNDPKGDWTSGDPSAKSGGDSTYFPIHNPLTGEDEFPPKGRYWGFSKESCQEYIRTGKIVFKEKRKASERGFIFKRYKNELRTNHNPVGSLFATDNEFMNQQGTRELQAILDGNFFSNPKPVSLIKKLIQYSTNLFDKKSAVILDFFAGSGTTGHAVLELNASDGGHRQFILCTNNENGIAENVTYPRIKKVIEGYGDKEGIPAEVRYFQTEFVEKDKEEGVTDAVLYEMVDRSTDMLKIRENTFTLVERKVNPRRRQLEIYTNVAKTKYTAVIYDTSAIEAAKSKIAAVVNGLPVAIYIFTLGDDSYDGDFDAPNWRVEPLPERILQVYRRLFRKK